MALKLIWNVLPPVPSFLDLPTPPLPIMPYQPNNTEFFSTSPPLIQYFEDSIPPPPPPFGTAGVKTMVHIEWLDRECSVDNWSAEAKKKSLVPFTVLKYLNWNRNFKPEIGYWHDPQIWSHFEIYLKPIWKKSEAHLKWIWNQLYASFKRIWSDLKQIWIEFVITKSEPSLQQLCVNLRKPKNHLVWKGWVIKYHL